MEGLKELLKEILAEVPKAVLIVWALGAILSVSVTILIALALIKYIGS